MMPRPIAPEIPQFKLTSCYRCGSPVRMERSAAYYKWRPVIRCTNRACRIMMFGWLYGDNGVLDPAATSYEWEYEACRLLAERWNGRAAMVARTGDQPIEADDLPEMVRATPRKS